MVARLDNFSGGSRGDGLSHRLRKRRAQAVREQNCKAGGEKPQVAQDTEIAAKA